MGERASRKILRHRLEKQIARQQEEKRKELLKKRIDIAKEGVSLMEKGQVVGGVKRYSEYLLILEMWKKCGKNGLIPDLFDIKKDVFELVLISGIFWDFCKLYDKSKRPDQIAELRLYLKKYVQFSKGFPYQALSKEALRRYIQSGKCKHISDFKSAYSQLGGGKCFIAHALIENVSMKEITFLQLYRDQVLKKSKSGRFFIFYYYKYSPYFAKKIIHSPEWIKKSLTLTLIKPSVYLAKKTLRNETLHEFSKK